ncbi:hypothetical protein [Neorhizobium sp. DT-125]|uniref:hypothetical protein n=1 Tax=Neorhizobium sp. DT-125 TaxID=3396163 RepID=UPI003F197AEA
MRTITPMPGDGIEVYDVDSGIGGVFTVSIARELGKDTLELRVWYGKLTEGGWESYGLFDGSMFRASRSRLKNKRKLIIR